MSRRIPVRSLLCCIASVIACSLAPGEAAAQRAPWWSSAPDTLFFRGVILVTFRSAAIFPDYFCGHPWPDTSAAVQGYPAGRYVTPTTELIASEAVVRFLLDRCAMLESRWSELRRPCGEENRIEVTQWGDTLRFPFWTDCMVLFPEPLDVREFAAGLMRVDPGLFVDVNPAVKAYYQIRGVPGTDLSGR